MLNIYYPWEVYTNNKHVWCTKHSHSHTHYNCTLLLASGSSLFSVTLTHIFYSLIILQSFCCPHLLTMTYSISTQKLTFKRIFLTICISHLSTTFPLTFFFMHFITLFFLFFRLYVHPLTQWLTPSFTRMNKHTHTHSQAHAHTFVSTHTQLALPCCSFESACALCAAELPPKLPSPAR
jgi:hypothetical protein